MVAGKKKKADAEVGFFEADGNPDISIIYYLNKHSLFIEAPYKYKKDCRSIPSARWDAANRSWTATITGESIAAIDERFGLSPAQKKTLQSGAIATVSEEHSPYEDENFEPHIELDRENNQIVVFGHYEDRSILKDFEGYQWNIARKCWIYPLDFDILEQLIEKLPHLAKSELSSEAKIEFYLHKLGTRSQKISEAKVTVEPRFADGMIDVIVPTFLYKLTGSVRGAMFDRSKHGYSFNYREGLLEELHRFYPQALPGGARLKALEERFKSGLEDNFAASLAKEADLKVSGLGGELLPFQRAGVAYAVKSQRCFIADEMGLGKTIEALASIHALNAYPVLIVTPAIVKLNWQKEARKWLPEDKKIAILNAYHSKKIDPIAEAGDADVVIINYDIVRKFFNFLKSREFKGLICDESHYVKNMEAKRTKAVLKISELIGVKLLLTGTPVTNRPVELISQLAILGRLQEFGGNNYFLNHYCASGEVYEDYRGARNLKELNLLLRQKCFIRRNKQEVLTELPDKRHSKLYFDLDEDYIKAYNDKSRAYENALREFSELLANDAGGDREQHQSAVKQSLEVLYGLLIEMKHITGQGKIKSALRWVEDFLETGEKLVLFGVHLDVLHAFREAFPEAVVIDGSISAERRQEAVETFQNDPKVRLAILQLNAAGVGITLTAASNVAFIEQGWTPAEHQQAEDRCHRIGQTQCVNCWYFLADGTVDIKIDTLISEKRAIADEVTDGAVVDHKKSVIDELIESTDLSWLHYHESVPS